MIESYNLEPRIDDTAERRRAYMDEMKRMKRPPRRKDYERIRQLCDDFRIDEAVPQCKTVVELENWFRKKVRG